MPTFVVHTNVAKKDVPPALFSEATEELAKAVGVGSEYFAVQVTADQLMTFGGKKDPCALCYVHSIVNLNPSQNKIYSKLLCGLLKKHLGISSDRLYIIFVPMEATNVGWKDTTFDVFMP
ncbi:uncharacterized protein V6R79_010806 [Siganus canaliculatus]